MIEFLVRQRRAEILRELDRIEREHNVRILHAIESGSRVWGFPSTDSDYDVHNIPVDGRYHRTLADASMTARLFLRIQEDLAGLYRGEVEGAGFLAKYQPVNDFDPFSRPLFSCISTGRFSARLKWCGFGRLSF